MESEGQSSAPFYRTYFPGAAQSSLFGFNARARPVVERLLTDDVECNRFHIAKTLIHFPIRHHLPKGSKRDQNFRVLLVIAQDSLREAKESLVEESRYYTIRIEQH